jgi:UDPglucose--hexose-1-phosphate uridylyltransferase
MDELRWHPLYRQWVAVATERQDRPQLPADWCPFCPKWGRVPEGYDVLLYPNDFPAFALTGGTYEPHDPAGYLYQTTGARGACDVVLYHPDHNLRPSELSAEHWRKIIGVWTRRTQELAALPGIEYVYVFENTGVAIGVTMPHPHGQIYAFPFLPPLVATELDSAASHYAGQRECLYCNILGRELEDGRRVFAENDSFVAFIPFFARFPAEGQIYARRHFQSLSGMSEEEACNLAALIRIARRKYDALFGAAMPLMMIVRQAPAKGDHPCFHFHVEFLPIQRSATKLKYLASVESAAGTFLNDTQAEERAARLRDAEPR